MSSPSLTRLAGASPWADLIASRIPPGLVSEALGLRLEDPGLETRMPLPQPLPPSRLSSHSPSHCAPGGVGREEEAVARAARVDECAAAHFWIFLDFL